MKPRRVPRLSLDLLRGFRAAARHLSFTAAARELSVTQSAISHEIRALEDQLGTPLFTRANRTLRLTEAGERLYKAAVEALSVIDSTVEEVTGASRALSITTSVPFASLWLSPRLPGFTKLHPEISLRIVASNDSLDLAREGIDVAIRLLWEEDAAAPAEDRLCDVTAFPVCSPALMRKMPIESAADLARHVLLHFETVRNGRPWHDWPHWLDKMKLRGLKPAGILRFTHYDQLIEAALAGSGVAVGRWPHLATYLNSGTLVAPLKGAGVTRVGRYHVIVRTSSRSSIDFSTWLHKAIKADIGKESRPLVAKRQRPYGSTRP